MPYRVTHMLLASGLTVAFLVAGLSAWRWLRGDRAAGVERALKTGVVLAAILIPIQIFAGDQHGLNTLHHQPQKVAAMEGVWETERGAGLRLFAIPDEATRSNRYEIVIPNLASWILTHSADGQIRGLNEFVGNHPPVAPVFFAFRIMVGVGVLMLLVSWWGAWVLRRRGVTAWLARALIPMTFSGWVATLAGWYTTEIGRQPWLVTGVLRTRDAAGPVPTATIGASLTLYILLYVGLLLAYILTLMYLARRPDAPEPEESGHQDPLNPAPAE
jgi:cytochrome d ubiquinol oxidase subunit I